MPWAGRPAKFKGVEWLFIRHGEAAGDPYAEPGPSAQGFLSNRGEMQALALREHLENWQPSAVWTSPYGRAVRTASLVFPGVVPRQLPSLREWLPAPEMRGADSTKWELMNQRAGDAFAEDTWKTPLGEGTLEMLSRVGPPFLAELKTLGVHARHGGFVVEGVDAGTIRLAVVAHGGSLGALLGFILGVPPFPVSRFSFELCGVGRMVFQQKRDVWYPQLILR